MPIIILPKEVASRIAAGEVVERPVSVVKELVENSIDAGATEIQIRVEQAGKKLIEIIDNGMGIESDQSELALQRYATSKIATSEDLERIRTLGFRGEALASIAAVSRFTIESRVKNEEKGFNYLLEGGEKHSKKSIGRSVGTLIRVEDLFFNVPARLKFLKKDITENRLITILINKYALFYAGIRFSLFQDRKNFLATNGNNKRREILSQIYDLETAKSLLPVDYSDEYLQIEGFTSPLNITRSSRKEIFFFINGRLVSDSTLTSAITHGYQGLIMVGRYPITNLFITLSPNEIDVNVHPTKAEIRLRNSNRVFTAIQRIMRKTIAAYAPFPIVPPGIWKTGNSRINIENVELHLDQGTEILPDRPILKKREIDNGSSITTTGLPLLRPLGQLGLTYIAAEGPDGLYLIDQHAAHERILFEKMLGLPEGNKLSQLLLEPVVIQLPSYQFKQLENQSHHLVGLGFELEPFGPDAYKITAVPQVISSLDPKDAIMSVIEEADHDPYSNLVENEIKEKMIARICKRLAVKGGQVLSSQEQNSLIRDLESCKNPRTCPHGRPTMIHISVSVLEKQFGRQGSI
ncbi:MAG: DNA mismatch repair endonuclease MutL [Pelolinea sp.]|nr:DNA mismatch repair endonuclease MutL [Pelolinea sp.]